MLLHLRPLQIAYKHRFKPILQAQKSPVESTRLNNIRLL